MHVCVCTVLNKPFEMNKRAFGYEFCDSNTTEDEFSESQSYINTLHFGRQRVLKRLSDSLLLNTTNKEGTSIK